MGRDICRRLIISQIAQFHAHPSPRSSLILEDLPSSLSSWCTLARLQNRPAAIPRTNPPVLCSASSLCPALCPRQLARRQPTGSSPRSRFAELELPSREETKPIRLALFKSPLLTYYPLALAPRLVTARHWWSASSRSTCRPPLRRPAARPVHPNCLLAASATDPSISLDFPTTRGCDIGGKGAHEMPHW